MIPIHFQQHLVELAPGESVLDGLVRHGLPVRWSCRAGSCHCCMLRATEGNPPPAAQAGLQPQLRQKGYFLPCKAFPDAPISIAEPLAEDLRSEALVAECHGLSEDIRCIRLEVAEHIAPLPGQHIRVVHPDGSARSYSVASRPACDYFVELHVRRVPGGRVSTWLCDQLGPGDTVMIQPPAGTLVNRNPSPGQQLLLVATGTGLAPMLPLLHQALERDDPELAVWLLHGGRVRADLYAHADLTELAWREPRFHYQAWLSQAAGGGDIQAGRVTDGLRRAFSDLSGFRVFIAGHPDMVAAAKASCLAMGVDPAADLLSDAFEYEHRRPNAPQAPEDRGQARRAPPPDPQLWARLENGRILRDVLRDVYELAFADALLGPYFKGVTQQRLREKQYSFLRSLMLGTRDYFGQRPRNAHHWMVISDALFDYRLDLMTRCMREHGLIEPWIQRWHRYEEFFRHDIVKDQPTERLVAGQPVQLEGIEDGIVDEGCLCDGCGREVAAGSEVRFHLRLGTIHCVDCRAAGAMRPGGDGPGPG